MLLTGHAKGLICRVECPATDADAAATILHGLGSDPLALVILWVDPETPHDTLAQVSRALAPTPVIGCTTAGAIGAQGYVEGAILAIGLPARDFAASILLIDGLQTLDGQKLISDTIRARGALAQAHPGWAQDFAFLMVDGLSRREDDLAATLAPGLGATPLFGGSAADGDRFAQTFVFHDGRALQDAAVLALVRTRCAVKVFKFDHFTPTDTRMVVTGADPARRVVTSLNAEPAGREYARILGKDPGQLTPFLFAAHPVVVRLGGRHYVRSIRQVDEHGDLYFFSAIDEGLVLTLAQAQDMVSHLGTALASLGQPGAILGCDCLLRRIEAREKQVIGQISALLRDHGVTGFSTYGEQLNAMHVNQTLTGVALYAPGSA